MADLGAAAPTAAKLLPPSVVRGYDVFPLREDDRCLYVATADPTNLDADQAVGFASGRSPVFEVAAPGPLRDAIADRYTPDQPLTSMLELVNDDVDSLVEVVDTTGPADVTAGEVERGPLIKLSNLILRDALSQAASDIHIQPGAAGGVVRFRVDGVLRQYMPLPLPVLDRLVSRIKVMGQLDIANRLKPQDGRTTIKVGGKRVDLRISTVPTRDSEKAVVRLLDPVGTGSLDSVGLPAPELVRLKHLLTLREGIVVVTGPTGSGKTTTLYAALRELATADVNIMTVEDPVEYEVKGLTQIQVEPLQGVTFPSALRAILRQDPDIILVGEIRDAETAKVAVQASMTGHLVLATLHTNDAVGAVSRLVDLGLERSTIADTLRGVLAQRLVRRVCLRCSAPAVDPLTPEERALESTLGTRQVVRVSGCVECGQSGYRGRLPVAEILSMTPELQSLTTGGGSTAALQSAAVAAGMRTLHAVALECVGVGATTLQEVQRIIGGASDDVGPTDGAPQAGVAGVGSVPAVIAERGSGDSETRVPTEPPPSTAAAPVSHNPPPPADAEPAGDEGAVRPPHVLVVDDEPMNRVLARALLEKAGHRVTEAEDGLAALLCLEGDAYDLMLLDLDMPKLSGYEVLSHTRRQVATAGMPVIVVTGSTDSSSEIEVMESGADDYVRKPLESRRFLARVKAALRRARG